MKKIIYHYLIPHSGNNHRAKLLHNSSLFIISLFLFGLTILFHSVGNARPDVLGISYSISDGDLLSITNMDREQSGLPPLRLNEKLQEAAALKAQDMMAKNYWAHFAPDGTTPWDFIRKEGYQYSYAGENLAKGFSSSQAVVQAWMNSPSHRENMLSNKYTDVGFAVVEGNLVGEDTVLVVEMFGAPESQTYASAQSVPVRSAPSQIQVTPQVPQITEPIITQTVQTPSTQSVVLSNQGKKPGSVKKTGVYIKPLIDSSVFSKSFLFMLFPIFFFTLLVDVIIVERKKIPRFVGHNLDHIMLIGFFLLMIVLQRSGSIF